ncbi:HAD-IA family hydrolase [Micromonospora halophytica]|uniref:AHBA synthesis associated protein n=1 Tax=Micromonospora halophytica TaxID=47864 RepID=A0A1C5IJD8_9ACTN|nr:HAD-IA family hydrolase [Micromonospora halophytica]SCG58355.1 AHBA synthesis associated protein [Micromonospora halophytica]
MSRAATERPVPGDVRAVVFDLDGVLIDSLTVAREAFALAYAEVVGDGVAPVDEYCRHPGRYLPEVLRMMGLPAAMAAPFVRESNRLAHLVVPLPGAPELLGELRRRGVGLAVATGRSGARARHVLDLVGMLPLVDHVVGSDEVRRPKPAPDIVLRALELLAVRPADALMVGDAPADLASAHAAGVVAVAALWGESDPRTLRAAGPDVTLARVDELLALCVPPDGGHRGSPRDTPDAPPVPGTTPPIHRPMG